MQFRATLVWYASRVFLHLDYFMTVAQRALAWVQHEVLWRISSEHTRFAVNQRLYQMEQEYYPGSDFFNDQLFDWEKTLLEMEAFPKHGRLLLLAAGAGREVQALADLGYEIVCLEPNPSFYAAAAAHFSERQTVHWVRASFADVSTEWRRTGDPSELSRSFDAVWIGWGALSYLHTEAEQRNLLSTLRRNNPRAPIVMSFLMQTPVTGAGSRFRDRWLGKSVGASRVFFRRSGFTYLYTQEQIVRLADDTSYEIKTFRMQPYPHALFVPKS